MLRRDMPEIAACMVPIIEDYQERIQPGHQVLEIGCGYWSALRDRSEQVGAHWEGIDAVAEYMGRKVVATRVENLADLSFESDRFDFVMGNQTMEHWGEYGCDLSWGLYQCFRVLKPGGTLLLNVPIHFHGTREFMLGDYASLERLFAPFSSQVHFERWAEPRAPLPPCHPFPHYWAFRNRPAYILDVQAVKDRPLPSGYDNRAGCSGARAQLRNRPLSWNVYRVLRKLRFVR